MQPENGERSAFGKFGVTSVYPVTVSVEIATFLSDNQNFIKIENSSIVLSTKAFFDLLHLHHELPVRGHLIAVDNRESCVRKGVEGYDTLSDRTLGPCRTTVPFTLSFNITKQAFVKTVTHSFIPASVGFVNQPFIFDYFLDPYNPDPRGLKSILYRMSWSHL
jgi:hypothetical protein